MQARNTAWCSLSCGSTHAHGLESVPKPEASGTLLWFVVSVTCYGLHMKWLQWFLSWGIDSQHSDVRVGSRTVVGCKGRWPPRWWIHSWAPSWMARLEEVRSCSWRVSLGPGLVLSIFFPSFSASPHGLEKRSFSPHICPPRCSCLIPNPDEMRPADRCLKRPKPRAEVSLFSFTGFLSIYSPWWKAGWCVTKKESLGRDTCGQPADARSRFQPRRNVGSWFKAMWQLGCKWPVISGSWCSPSHSE